jgi:hypothetical protein
MRRVRVILDRSFKPLGADHGRSAKRAAFFTVGELNAAFYTVHILSFLPDGARVGCLFILKV